MSGAASGVGGWLGARRTCAYCAGAGFTYDPPLEQQEEEGRAGQRTHLAKRPCGCRTGALIVNGEECSIDAG